MRLFPVFIVNSLRSFFSTITHIPDGDEFDLGVFFPNKATEPPKPNDRFAAALLQHAPIANKVRTQAAKNP